MNWETWFCPNGSCTSEAWMLQRDPTMRDSWWVAAHEDDDPFTVAATVRICPRCGIALRSLDEAEGGLDEQVGAEVGPIFDFVRSLA